MSKVKEINEYIKNIPNETYLKETDYDKNLMKELYDIEKKPFVIDYKKNDNNQILDSESDSELELSTISDSTRGGKKIKKRKSLKRKTMKSKKTKKTKKSRKTKKTRKSKKRNSRRKSYN